MEKVKLNNQIVCMRKYVKQAKVHVINKIVKQVKFLQNRKGDDVKVQKAKRKAERLLEAVAIVKKIKPDDISKLALSKDKDWKGILQQKNASVHDRCTAMLANYGAVQKEVEAFYSANKELVLKITDYIAQWDEKNKISKDLPTDNKTSSIKKSNKNAKEANFKNERISSSNYKNKLKAIVETTSSANTDVNEDAFQMYQNDKKIDLEAEVQQSNNIRNSIKSTNEIKDLDNDEINSFETEESDEDDDGKESESGENDEKEKTSGNFLSNNKEDGNSRKDSNDKICKSVSESNSLFRMDNNSKNKLKAITLLNLNELEGLDEIPIGSSFENEECEDEQSSEDEIIEASQSKSTDPFFLGHNTEDFNPKNNSDDSDTANRTKNYAPFKHNTETPKNDLFHKSNNKFSPTKKFKREEYNEKSFKRDKFAPRKFNNKFQEKNVVKNRSDFKSKNKQFSPRNTFDKKQFRNISKDYRNKDSSMKNNLSYKKGGTNESLHPSWEAKRKQKELLNTSFQGKRMVFDD